MINFEQWEGFEGRIWKEEVNVRDFIQKNYTPYDGDESFLAGPTEATDKLWGALHKAVSQQNALRHCQSKKAQSCLSEAPAVGPEKFLADRSPVLN